jgi:protein phosphatase
VAAQLAVRSIINFFDATGHEFEGKPEFDQFGFPTAARRLSSAIHKANGDVVQISKESDQHHGMGTTIVAILFSARSGLMHLAHVGDSRCYRSRAGTLELLTQDHSLYTDVIEQRPDIADVVLKRLPKHVVTRALGMDEQLRVSIGTHAVLPGDRYLLCSDGLSSPVSEDVLSSTLAAAEAPGVVTARLVELANEAGGPDNVSAVVVDCFGEVRASELDDEELEAPAGDFDDEDPEILILGIEELDPRERPYSASDGLLHTLGELIKRGK